MNEHKNIITIEDEVKQFSDKPVKSDALFKKFASIDSSMAEIESATQPFNICLKVYDTDECALLMKKYPYKTPCTPALLKSAMETANLEIVGVPLGGVDVSGNHYTINQWIATPSGGLTPTYTYTLVLSTIDYTSTDPVLQVAKLTSADNDTQLTGTISYYTLS